MDAVYPLRHSPHADDELRYSLRSLARHAPWVRKVWVLGDRPAWLADDPAAVEHVPHDALAWVPGCATPVVNTFLLMYLSALHPGVAPEYLWVCDDYVLLADLAPDAAARPRHLGDLDAAAGRRGGGAYKDALWRTYDLLKRLGYPRLNFEAHVPAPLTKARVLAAVKDFRDFITADRFYGPLAQLSVLNHAHRHEGLAPVDLRAEGSYAGFHFRPAAYEDVAAGCAGKLFLNFDDEGFGPGLRRFLAERFPDPCRYEAGGPRAAPVALPAPHAAAPPPPAAAEPAARPPAPPPVTTGPPAGPAEPVADDRPLGLPPAAGGADPDPAGCVVLVLYRGPVARDCEAGLRDLERRGYPVRRVAADAAADPARDRAAADALADGFAETLWVDPDVGFRADQVDRVRGHGLPVCGGVYPVGGRRGLSVHPLPGTPDLLLGRGGGVTEVLYAGAGFLHVRRWVYEHTAARLGLPACEAGGGRVVVPYFQPLVRPRGDGHWYLGEEYAFCHRVRAAGVAVAVDTTLRLTVAREAVYGWEEAGSKPQRFATFRYRFGP